MYTQYFAELGSVIVCAQSLSCVLSLLWMVFVLFQLGWASDTASMPECVNRRAGMELPDPGSCDIVSHDPCHSPWIRFEDFPSSIKRTEHPILEEKSSETRKQNEAG